MINRLAAIQSYDWPHPQKVLKTQLQSSDGHSHTQSHDHIFKCLAIGPHLWQFVVSHGHMIPIYKVFVESWGLLPVSVENCPYWSIGVLNKHDIHLITTAKKVLKLGWLCAPIMDTSQGLPVQVRRDWVIDIIQIVIVKQIMKANQRAENAQLLISLMKD